jgi:uncharacterized cupredoxin-like copper-binding protein
VLACAIGVLPALALGACGSGATVGGSVVNIQERDFHIGAPQHVRAGSVTLRVHNSGPDRHELIVVHSDRALPIRPDGLTVNEEAVQHDEPGLLEPAGAGAVRDLTVNLAPGRYVLFCNMAGHYLGGMHTTLVVTQ